LQEIAHHRKVVAVAAILVLEIGEIGRGHVKPLRQHTRDDKRDRRLLTHERRGIIDLVNHRVLCRAHCGSVGRIQQHRHFAEHCTWFNQGGDDGVAPDHLEPSLDQHIKMAGPAALAEHFRAGGDVPPDAADAIFKNFAHPPTSTSDKNRHRVRQGRTDHAPWVLKLSATLTPVPDGNVNLGV